MRGKKPKERDKYIIRMGDGTLVEVSREVYLEWYGSKRKERYQKERDRKYGVCSIESLEEKGCLPEIAITNMWNMTEENALRNIYRDKLWEAIRSMPIQDIQLIRLLYFDECTITKAAEVLGCSRKCIVNRRERILGELRRMMEGARECQILSFE